MPDTTSEKRPRPANQDTGIIPGTVLVPGPSQSSTNTNPDESQLPEDPPGGGDSPGEDLE